MGKEQGVSPAEAKKAAKNRLKSQKRRDREKERKSAARAADAANAAGAVVFDAAGAVDDGDDDGDDDDDDDDGDDDDDDDDAADVTPAPPSIMSGEATSRQVDARREKEAREALETAAAAKRRDELAREMAVRKAASAAILATQGSAPPKIFGAAWQGEGKRTIGGSYIYQSFLLGGVVVNVGDWVEVQGEAKGQGRTTRKRRRNENHSSAIWIGRILGLWRDPFGVDRAALAWAYKPEEMRCGRLPSHGSRELATSQKADIVEVETFLRRARVISASELDERGDPDASSSDESASRDTRGGGARSPSLRARSRVAVYNAQTFYDEATASTRVLFLGELECPTAINESAVIRVADGTALVGTLTGLGISVASGTGVHMGGGGGGQEPGQVLVPVLVPEWLLEAFHLQVHVPLLLLLLHQNHCLVEKLKSLNSRLSSPLLSKQAGQEQLSMCLACLVQERL